MFRVSAFLMATLLLFSTMPVSLAQQDSVKAQAEADASADMSRYVKIEVVSVRGSGEYCGVPSRLCRRIFVRGTQLCIR